MANTNPLLTGIPLPRTTTTTGPPTTQIGSMLPEHPFSPLTPGWSVMEAQRVTVPTLALKWPRSVLTYEDMRRDTQIQGLYNSVFLPIRHMQWYVDPAGARAEFVEEVAEDFGLPIGDEDQPLVSDGVEWDEYTRLALLALALGHRYFEESGTIGDDGKYRLGALSDRPPSTLSNIYVAPSGDLVAIQQYGSLPPPQIPAEHLVACVWDREGADWAGRPMSYGLYRSWLLKDELIRGDAVVHRRFSGIPVMQETAPGAATKEAQEKAAQISQSVRSGDTSGLFTPYGIQLRLAGVEGTLPDAIKSAIYHDQQMSRAFLQMFADLGTSAHGSHALGLTLVDHFEQGVLAVARWHQRNSMRLVSRIGMRNYGPGEKLPIIGFRQDNREDIAITDLVDAVDAGVIVVDDDLEAAIRYRSFLPPRNPAEPGRTPPAVAPPPANPASSARPRRERPKASAAAAGDNPGAASQTDFAALQAQFEATVTQLAHTWTGVQAAQIDELVKQIKLATTIAELAAIVPDVAGASVLTSALTDVIEHGAQTAIDDAAAQGVTIDMPDLSGAQATVAGAADAVATLLAHELGASAASRAVALAGGGLDFTDIADQVRDHLEGLAGATPEYEISGLASRAQNEGRFTVLDASPGGTRFYSSELNDLNTCEFCEHEDGTEFTDMADARRDYPGGGFVSCEGGNRCRGTVIAVYAETPGQTS